MPEPLIVLKLGGSVLHGPADLACAVDEIQRWTQAGTRVVAVVSAFEGTTDALLRSAALAANRTPTAAHTSPDASAEQALALLLSTGECTTAALLTLALQASGVSARVLPPHVIGLLTTGRLSNADPCSLDRGAITDAFQNALVSVVPGFIGVDPQGYHALLGRGGSDLTALFIASALGARCRLLKDVDGLYESDPALEGPPPRRFRTLSWEDALRLDEGIVQHKAIRLACQCCLSFEVGAVGREDTTTIGPYPIQWHAEHQEHVYVDSA